jgi:hypothetical protein
MNNEAEAGHCAFDWYAPMSALWTGLSQPRVVVRPRGAAKPKAKDSSCRGLCGGCMAGFGERARTGVASEVEAGEA